MTELFISIFHIEHIDYASPPIELHVEEEHAEAEGLVVRQGDSTLVTVWGGVVTGQMTVFLGQTTPELEVFYLDLDSIEFQPHVDDGFLLADSLGDLAVATLSNIDDWSFSIHGESAGATELFLSIFHIDHLDYISPAMPVVVTDCCVGVRGDVNYDQALNIVDLTYLASYLFSDGSEPLCMRESDVNGNGATNIVDLTYLTAYLFSGGPAPVSCL